MDAGKQQQQQQMQQQQQFMMMQQIQRQKDAAMSRFPSNIDVHLRPQNHPSLLTQHNNHQQQLHRPQLNPTPTNTNLLNPNNNNSNNNSPQLQPPPHQKAAMQFAYQDAWRVCHPDFKKPFSSIEDACERLLPYHVVADYEAEEDDKILDSDTTGQLPSRSQQWDHNIAAKVAEFTATFEKQVLAFNIISRKRGLGEFRTEEKLMMEQLLLQDEKRATMEFKAEQDSWKKATQENNMRMAAMVHAEQARAESQAHAEMMARAPIRASALGSRGSSVSIGHDPDEEAPHDEIMNGWGVNAHKDDKEPSEDFLNDDETENGDTGLQSEWHGGGEFDLNAR